MSSPAPGGYDVDEKMSPPLERTRLTSPDAGDEVAGDEQNDFESQTQAADDDTSFAEALNGHTILMPCGAFASAEQKCNVSGMGRSAVLVVCALVQVACKSGDVPRRAEFDCTEFGYVCPPPPCPSGSVPCGEQCCPDPGTALAGAPRPCFLAQSLTTCCERPVRSEELVADMCLVESARVWSVDPVQIAACRDAGCS